MALMIREQWSTITSPEYLFALKLPVVIRFCFAFASTVSYLTLGRTRKFIAPPLYKGCGGGGGGWMETRPPKFCFVAVFRNEFSFSGKPLIFLKR